MSGLEVVSVSTVDTPAHRRIDKRADWQTVTSDSVADRWAEYLSATSYVDDAALDAQRNGIVQAMTTTSTPRDAVDMAVRAVRDRITYTPGVTSVYTTAQEAWTERHGVCQDFAHANPLPAAGRTHPVALRERLPPLAPRSASERRSPARVTHGWSTGTVTGTP